MNLSNNNDKNKIGPAGCPICPSCFCILCIRLSSAKINLYCDRCSFSEKYEVYDTEADEADEPIGYFYEYDKEGLLERIKEKKS